MAEESYTRFSATLNFGDGPDNRGSITVELSRSTDDASAAETHDEFVTHLEGARDELMRNLR